MKKPINVLLLVQTLLLITIASIMFSSCIIVGTDDDPDITIRHPKTTVVTTSAEAGSAPATPVPAKYRISCKNETSFTITDWCVKKDNVVTFANSGFSRSIRPGDTDMITDLPEGYYKVYFTFENCYDLEPEDYLASESVYLDRDVTYCIFARAHNYVAECRSAAETEPQFFLKGSDGSEIELIKK